MLTTTRHRNARRTFGATEYAEQLARTNGCGREFPPVECWTVQGSEISKVNVVMVRGHCDNREWNYDYAETDQRSVISSRYLFPTKTNKRPVLVEMEDDFGKFRDWCSEPKK